MFEVSYLNFMPFIIAAASWVPAGALFLKLHPIDFIEFKNDDCSQPWIKKCI